MRHDFDLAPTAGLRGSHLRGVVRRRVLVNYPVPPERLGPWLPPQAEPALHAGRAWVSACAVRLERMAPTAWPAPLGLRMHYLVHRTIAWLPFPDGTRRCAVLILEANLDHPATFLARGSTRVPFRRRCIRVDEGEGHWAASMRSSLRIQDMHRDGGGAGEDGLLYEACVEAPGGPATPAGSLFPDAASADRFLLGVAYGCAWDPRRRRMRYLAETHDPWTIEAAPARTARNRFLEDLCGGPVEADHALLMRDVPHAFAMRPATMRFDPGAGQP